ncbi:MAG: ABC transporter permease [Devosia sp.]
MIGFLRQQSWVIGLFVLFIVLLFVTRMIQPGYGARDFASLTQAAMPYAFAVAAQAIVVLAGGIDLSIAAMMAVTSVTAAVLMRDSSPESALYAVPLVVAFGFLLGSLNGLLIVLTRVPDIVVTLAMLYVFQGLALLILNTPGPGASEWLRAIAVGSLDIPGVPTAITAWLPGPLVFIAASVAIIWAPLRRSQLGLSIYAIGSHQLSAFRSGVPIHRTRILAYGIGGIFASLGGLSLTMSTGIGAPIPGPYLLASVAAVVLGGVALTGGRGGLVGPIIAVFVLRLVRTDMTLLSIDPNVTTIVEGIIMVVVVMLGALVAMRSRPS